MSSEIGSLLKHSSTVQIWDVDLLCYRWKITKYKHFHMDSTAQDLLVSFKVTIEHFITRNGLHGDSLTRANNVEGRVEPEGVKWICQFFPLEKWGLRPWD